MRPVLTLMGIFLLVWLLMIVGFWVIDELIVPIELHNAFLTNFSKLVISAVLVLAWLLLWRKMVYSYFSRQLRKAKGVQ